MVFLCPDTVQNVIMHDRDRAGYVGVRPPETFDHLKGVGRGLSDKPSSAAIQF